MKVLLVFAHPERHSLNGALRDVAVAELKAQGHEVRISDLYAEGWKASVDRADFPELADDERLRVWRSVRSGVHRRGADRGRKGRAGEATLPTR